MKTHDADRIARKDHVDPGDTTPARDSAARFIDKAVIEPGRWRELSLTDIANMSDDSDLEFVPEDGWSRQHVANVIDAYYDPVFERADGSKARAEGIEEHEESIPVPEDLDDAKVAAFVRGYLRAKKRYQ